MLSYIGLSFGFMVAMGVLALFIYTALKTINDLKTITKETEKRRVVRLCTLYENIFERFVLPKSFLYMKNRGDDLCEFDGEIPYINYEFEDFFM